MFWISSRRSVLVPWYTSFTAARISGIFSGSVNCSSSKYTYPNTPFPVRYRVIKKGFLLFLGRLWSLWAWFMIRRFQHHVEYMVHESEGQVLSSAQGLYLLSSYATVNICNTKKNKNLYYISCLHIYGIDWLIIQRFQDRLIKCFVDHRWMRESQGWQLTCWLYQLNQNQNSSAKIFLIQLW